MRKFSVFLGIILFVQILYSCTSPIIPYSIDAKKEDPPLETLINWEGWYTIKAIKPFSSFLNTSYFSTLGIFKNFSSTHSNARLSNFTIVTSFTLSMKLIISMKFLYVN